MIFFLPSHAKNVESKVYGSVILCTVCMGMKIGLLLKGKNTKGYLRTGFWGKMLWPKEVQVPGQCRERHDKLCGLFSSVTDITACFLRLCGTCISTGMPPVGFWYIALIKYQNKTG